MPDFERDHFPLGEKMPEPDTLKLQALFEDRSAETTGDQIKALAMELGISDFDLEEFEGSQDELRDQLSIQYLNERSED